MPNARIWIATQRGASLDFPETTSDADGIINLGILPGIHEAFAITAKGFAPELVSEAIGNTPKTFNVNLTSGNLLTGSLLDPSGKPVANALVLIQSWRGQEKPFDEEMRTDNYGKFSWPDAPADDIIVSAGSTSGNKKNVILRAGKENTIHLLPPSRLTGTVVDAITNQPLSNYRVFYGNGETSKQIFLCL